VGTLLGAHIGAATLPGEDRLGPGILLTPVPPMKLPGKLIVGGGGGGGGGARKPPMAASLPGKTDGPRDDEPCPKFWKDIPEGLGDSGS
jgi:hypothetical protein